MQIRLLDRLRRTRAEIHQTHQMVSNQSHQVISLLQDTQRMISELAGAAQEHVARPCTTRQPETWVPPGHFYSPIVDTEELQRRRAHVFDRSRRPIDVDLREEAQLALLHRLKPHYDRLPFTENKQDGLRYYYENPAFSYADAIILACLLMELRPKRIVEVGSGFSSCVTLDVNDRFLDGLTQVAFVEPYPDLLYSLMTPGDRDRYPIHATPVQDVDLTVIDQLTAGDILFIDSTHVSKGGSDVNFEFFTILPRLKSGVYIHFHDMFYPFEYPEEWFFGENRSWNELYLMRAFLAGNRNFEIVFFNHFMHLCHQAEVAAQMPLFARNPGGSLWIRKL